MDPGDAQDPLQQCCAEKTLQMVLNLGGSRTIATTFLHKQEQMESSQRSSILQEWV